MSLLGKPGDSSVKLPNCGSVAGRLEVKNLENFAAFSKFLEAVQCLSFAEERLFGWLNGGHDCLGIGKRRAEGL